MMRFLDEGPEKVGTTLLGFTVLAVGAILLIAHCFGL